MSQHLAARRSAIAHRGRLIASLVGLLAIVVALFATAASAGVRTPGSSYATKPPAGKPDAKPPAPEHKPATKPAHDHNDDNDEPAGEDKDHSHGKPVGCDGSGPYARHEREGHTDRHAGDRDDAECVPPRGPKCGVEGEPACREDHQPVCGVYGKPACDNDNPPVDNTNNPPVDNANGRPEGNNNNPNQQQPTTTVAARQAGQPAPATQPAVNQPRLQVAGTRAARATARLRAQTRCGTRSFRVTISGRSIRRVTLFVAGHRVRTVTVPAGRRSITVNVPVRRFGARRQSVRARVTFRNGAAPRTLSASATRCAQTAVRPQFTG